MKTKNEKRICPLCGSEKTCGFFQDKRRDYYECSVCSLIFVPSAQFLSFADEKKRYDLHRNSPEDPGYRRYLSRMFIPLRQCLNPESRGLDFGSGPAPTLSLMFEEAGHHMTLYDAFYKREPAALEQQYDFITATEVVEHLREPGRELERLWACLQRGGHLGIMTQGAGSRKEFSQWHYKNDPTHVCFFSRAVFIWLALKWNADLHFADSDVVLFRKQAGVQYNKQAYMSLLHKCILGASTSSARTDKSNIIKAHSVRPEPVEG